MQLLLSVPGEYQIRLREIEVEIITPISTMTRNAATAHIHRYMSPARSAARLIVLFSEAKGGACVSGVAGWFNGGACVLSGGSGGVGSMTSGCVAGGSGVGNG